MKNDLLLRAARGEKTERPPVWLMRQAGRILPEYRAVREQAGSFINLVTNPELAAEVTIQPVDLLGVDAAIIFSDILVIPEAMGLPYQMEEKRGPYFPATIQSKKDVDALRVAVPEESLKYVTDAIRLAVQRLDGRVPLIGFAGAPWTIMAYMVEGGGSKTFSKPRQMLYAESELAHQLLEKITESTIAYLNAQVDAGASLVQLFDSWAGVLSPELYKTFCIPYITRICQALAQRVPVTVFALGASFAFPEISQTGCRVVGIDWHTAPETARQLCGSNVTLQGNLDPACLYASDGEIRRQTRHMIDRFGFENSGNYIVNLGHGLYPDINPDKVRVFVEEVKQWKSK